MTWLYSDKTPVLLTLLFGLLTWQAGELFDEVRSGKAIIYDLRQKPPEGAKKFAHSIALRMENPSRSQVAGPFSFAVNCKKAGCLTGKTSTVVEEPTFADVAVDDAKSPDRAMIRATLAPGAVAWLVAEAHPTKTGEAPEVTAIFDPNLNPATDGKSADTALRVIDAGSIEAKIVGGWLRFLFWGIILVVGAIIGWLVLAVISWKKSLPGAAGQTAPALSGNFELSDDATRAKLEALTTSINAQMTTILTKLEALSKGDDDAPTAPAR